MKYLPLPTTEGEGNGLHDHHEQLISDPPYANWIPPSDVLLEEDDNDEDGIRSSTSIELEQLSTVGSSVPHINTTHYNNTSDINKEQQDKDDHNNNKKNYNNDGEKEYENTFKNNNPDPSNNNNIDSTPPKHPLMGLIFMISSTFCFSIMALLIKLTGNPPSFMHPNPSINPSVYSITM